MRFEVSDNDNSLYVIIKEGNIYSSAQIEKPYLTHITEDDQNNRVVLLAYQANNNILGIALKDNFLQVGVTGNDCGIPHGMVHSIVLYEVSQRFRDAVRSYIAKVQETGVLVPIVMDMSMTEEQLTTAVTEAFAEVVALGAIPNGNALLTAYPNNEQGNAGAGASGGSRYRKTRGRRRAHRKHRTYKK